MQVDGLVAYVMATRPYAVTEEVIWSLPERVNTRSLLKYFHMLRLAEICDGRLDKEIINEPEKFGLVNTRKVEELVGELEMVVRRNKAKGARMTQGKCLDLGDLVALTDKARMSHSLDSPPSQDEPSSRYGDGGMQGSAAVSRMSDEMEVSATAEYYRDTNEMAGVYAPHNETGHSSDSTGGTPEAPTDPNGSARRPSKATGPEPTTDVATGAPTDGMQFTNDAGTNTQQNTRRSHDMSGSPRTFPSEFSQRTYPGATARQPGGSSDSSSPSVADVASVSTVTVPRGSSLSTVAASVEPSVATRVALSSVSASTPTLSRGSSLTTTPLSPSLSRGSSLTTAYISSGATDTRGSARQSHRSRHARDSESIRSSTENTSDVNRFQRSIEMYRRRAESMSSSTLVPVRKPCGQEGVTDHNPCYNPDIASPKPTSGSVASKRASGSHKGGSGSVASARSCTGRAAPEPATYRMNQSTDDEKNGPTVLHNGRDVLEDRATDLDKKTVKQLFIDMYNEEIYKNISQLVCDKPQCDESCELLQSLDKLAERDNTVLYLLLSRKSSLKTFISENKNSQRIKKAYLWALMHQTHMKH